MKFLSWNIRSLGGPDWKRKRGRIRQELAHGLTNGPLDFICLQEDRLKEAQILNYGNLLAGDWEAFLGSRIWFRRKFGGCKYFHKGKLVTLYHKKGNHH